jgi:tetratricopeptide (TPR) repeat protein
MRVWWEGASFGLRLFLNCTPIFCVGLSWLYTRISSRWIRLLGWIFVFWTFLLYLTVLTGDVDLNWYYPAFRLISLQWQQLIGILKPGALNVSGDLVVNFTYAILLIGSVIITILILVGFKKFISQAIRGRRYPLLASFGLSALGICLSVIIFLMGLNSHAHLPNWEKDLNQIESGLNSYSKFYIDYSFYIVHAEYLIAKGQEAEAIEEYQKAIQVYPAPMLYHRVVALLINNNRLDEARTIINKALNRWPENSDLLRQAAKLKNVSS